MKTASVHELKNDLKMMFVQRFRGHGFKLPVVLYTGTSLTARRLPDLVLLLYALKA